MAVNRFRAQVSRIEDLAPGVREIDLSLVDPPELEFAAGQHISVEVFDERLGRKVLRSYSIASPPRKKDTITLLFNSVPGGSGSEYLFHLQAHAQMEFEAPKGSFVLKDGPDRDVIFVATGTGIAPLRSMLYSRLEERGSGRTLLFWGLRSEKDLYYQEEFERLTVTHPKFTFFTTLSRPGAGWAGPVGRVTRLVEQRISSVDSVVFYLCGHGGMIADVTHIIQKKGLCPIHQETFYDEPGEKTGV